MVYRSDERLCKLHEHCNRFPGLRDRMRDVAFKRRAVLQQLEIEEHDYYLGLRLGHEVPLEEAALDFINTPAVEVDKKKLTHAERFYNAYDDRFEEASWNCNQRCGVLNCRATKEKDKYVNCPLTNGDIHRILKD